MVSEMGEDEAPAPDDADATGETAPEPEQSEAALVETDEPPSRSLQASAPLMQAGAADPAPEQSEAALMETHAEPAAEQPEGALVKTDAAPVAEQSEAALVATDAEPLAEQSETALVEQDDNPAPEQSEAALIEPNTDAAPDEHSLPVPETVAANGAAPPEKSARAKKGWGDLPKSTAAQSADAAAANGGLSTEALVESLLFVADGAVTIGNLAEALEVPARDIEAALAALGESYAQRGLSLQRFRDKVQLTTAPAAAARVERFLGLAAATPLSRAALEALAIIAYQQPVTRPQIEAVRGVNSDSVIKNLLSKGLVEESGRAEGPGRPVLYVTTTEFMQHFGLGSLGDLPPLTPPEADESSSPGTILKG